MFFDLKNSIDFEETIPQADPLMSRRKQKFLVQFYEIKQIKH